MAQGKYKQIESEYGLPMLKILELLYEKHGNQLDVARALGVSQPTISNWLMRFRLREVTRVVPASELEVEQAS